MSTPTTRTGRNLLILQAEEELTSKGYALGDDLVGEPAYLTVFDGITDDIHVMMADGTELTGPANEVAKGNPLVRIVYADSVVTLGQFYLWR